MDKSEIKGLGLSVQNIRRSIAVLRAEIAGLNADSWDLQKTVVDLREQIQKTHDDLKFEAENLGNEKPEEPEQPLRGPEHKLQELKAEKRPVAFTSPIAAVMTDHGVGQSRS
jgi:predicted  nucleic acid-binding Zn-ribbon protein